MVGRKVSPHPETNIAKLTIARTARTARRVKIIPTPPVSTGNSFHTVDEEIIVLQAVHLGHRCT